MSKGSDYMRYLATIVTGLAVTLGAACSGGGGAAGNSSNEFNLLYVTQKTLTPVATVEGTPIYADDVELAFQAVGQELAPVGSQEYATMLDEIIDQRLLALHAKRKRLGASPLGKKRLALAHERILGNLAVEDYLSLKVTTENARKLYAEQIKLRATGEEVRASHILLADKASAITAKKRLDAGENFASVASALSKDSSSMSDGGDLGYFQADAMVPQFSKVVFDLKVDEVSAPFETEFGWHIAKLVDRSKAVIPTFEELESEITNYLTMQEIGNLIKAVRKNAAIEISL